MTDQEQMPEAIGSVSYTLISPNGFSLIFTLRQPSLEELLEQISKAEVIFIERGYKPDIKRGFGRTKKPVETVPGRQCPQCNNPLVYFEAKGQKHIKCSTQKWDFTTKQATGCSFTEWADRRQPASAPAPQASTSGAVPPTTPPPPDPNY